MKFERLNHKHGLRLLSFETESKDYFESLIAPRADAFYSARGIDCHIEELNSAYAQSASYSLVLCDNNTIIARANFKEIDLKFKSAEIGYRVSQAYVGQGIGSKCAQELIALARHRLQLKKLSAYVLENNPASVRILEKNYFSKAFDIPEYVEHQGIYLSGAKYERNLAV
jgi:ribosomal-protein-alanine N-acetyltransferase